MALANHSLAFSEIDKMEVPHSVLAAGWIPFVIVLLLIIIFSFSYIRYFQSKYESEWTSTIASILGLAVALLTAALVPVDIFLVSFMKNSNGTFKEWANNNDTRQSLEDIVLYAYYSLYSIVVLFMFIILPFSYFFYEEGDEDITTRSRLCTAFKFTSVFVIIALVLILIGAFAPLKGLPNSNSTEWDQIKSLFHELSTTNGEDILSFIISSLTLVGMLVTILYTGYGLSAWPMDLVKGRRSPTKERMEIVDERGNIQAQIEEIQRKYHNGERISASDRRRLEDLEDRVHVMARRECYLEDTEKSCLKKISIIFRPFQIVFGVLFFFMTLLIFLSLLLTNIDKILHSAGWRLGYALPKRYLPNPIDITLVFAQQVFPVDYVLMTGMIMYFFFCSMGGLQHIGIWCCCIRMYKIRVRCTKPQGLLLLCFMLMFIVMAVNVIIYQITPQYSTFGSQHYIEMVNSKSGNGTHLVPHVLVCSMDAPPGKCVMTRLSLLLMRFFYKLWFFGAAYYYCSWALLGVILVSFIITLAKKRRSSVEGAVDRDDFDDSDEDLIRA